MTEPLLNHCDHGGATTVYAVQVPQWHRASGVTGVAINDGTTAIMAVSPRNHGDNGGATAVYAVQAPQWYRASGVTGV